MYFNVWKRLRNFAMMTILVIIFNIGDNFYCYDKQMYVANTALFQPWERERRDGEREGGNGKDSIT